MRASKALAFLCGMGAAVLCAGIVRPELPGVGPLAVSLRDALLPAPLDGPAPEIYYQYVDRGGAVRFVRSLEEVPVAHRASAGRVEIAGEPPSAPATASASRPAKASASPTARRFERVELYTASWCPHCRDAIADLSARRVDFRVREIDSDIDAKAELKERSGDLSVPQLYVDGRRAIVGYSTDAYDRVFGPSR